MPPLSFADARAMVLRLVRPRMGVESVALDEADGRVLAENIAADRDYPPFNRSARDGFAVRSTDLPGTLRVMGEVRAGEPATRPLHAGEAIEIMTGAPVPEGADAVLMIEHCLRSGESIAVDRKLEWGANISPFGSEAKAGAAILKRGVRLDYAAISWVATTGRAAVEVFARPRVAILATGDEIVEPGVIPAPHQIRNSNAQSLAAQVRRAGGIPLLLPVAPDKREATRRLIEQGLQADLLLLSGGVSAGRYDVVEPALADLGAEFFFHRVRIQPGQPLVFGRVGEKFFFGLPGNPGSTMVTFEVFARAALQLLAGENETPLPLMLARLTTPFRHKAGLTRFLPAVVGAGNITPLAWKGSGDVPGLCAANAFLVADAEREEYAKGDLIGVLLK